MRAVSTERSPGIALRHHYNKAMLVHQHFSAFLFSGTCSKPLVPGTLAPSSRKIRSTFPIMALEQLPPAFYSNRRELVTVVKRWAGSRSYAVTVKNSNKQKGFVYIACNCSGTIWNTHNVTPSTRQRVRPSQQYRCPFLVMGRRSGGVWGLTVRVGNHNY